MSCVGRWLRPDSRLAFQRQVRQTYRTHRTQSNIFADVGCAGFSKRDAGWTVVRDFCLHSMS